MIEPDWTSEKREAISLRHERILKGIDGEDGAGGSWSACVEALSG